MCIARQPAGQQPIQVVRCDGHGQIEITLDHDAGTISVQMKEMYLFRDFVFNQPSPGVAPNYIFGFERKRAQSLYDMFINNNGDVVVGDKVITVKMNRKRALPLLRESIPRLDEPYAWLGDKKPIFTANTHS